MRLFIAVRFSPEINDVLLDSTAKIRTLRPYANITREENLHLTLAFIGESERVSELKDILTNIAAQPFELAVCGTGNFGNLCWVGIERSAALSALVSSLRKALCDADFEIDTRPFKPHITLAREVPDARSVAEDLFIPRTAMTVSRISLMKSERIRGRLVYTEVFGRDL